MRSTTLAAALALFLILGVGCKSMHKDSDAAKEERTSMTALPQPVQDAFKRDYPNAKVDHIAKETEKSGAIHYEFKFADQSGRKQEVEYDGMGMRVPEEK